MKRFLSLCIAFVLILAFVPIQAGAATAEIIIHYRRTDDDYGDWNIWSWAAGRDGQAYPFNGQDDWGMVATFEIDEADKEVGFIVRTDAWAKDVEADRFIDLSLGNEIWVMTGQAEFTYEPPPGFGSVAEISNLEVVIRRHRYDGAYSKETALLRLDGKDFRASKTGEDAFGVTYKVTLPSVTNRQRYQLIFPVGGSEDGAQVYDLSMSRVTESTKSMEVFAVQHRDRLEEGEEPDLTKKIAEAVLDGPNLITVKLNYPASAGSWRVTDPNGADAFIYRSERLGTIVDQIQDDELEYDEVFELEMTEPLGSGVYTVHFNDYKDDYESRAVSIGKFFESEGFESMYTYNGELGALYSKDKTVFRLWSPTASEAFVNLYPSGNDSDASEKLTMKRIDNGAWEAEKSGDLKNIYYTYTVKIGDKENEAIDPYAKAAGVNGRRGMVVDLPSTNPAGWTGERMPAFSSPVDAVIYELHVRDLSTAANSGIENKGKYLAFTEKGTVSPGGAKTGVDHIVDLGVTHVHLLPVFDFRSVDETKLEQNNFNWGYDPENYNLPEGSYSTDPNDGNVRITEFKQMVQALHDSGLRVVMDVVYNHTGATADSNLNKLVPDYYYRKNANGSFSNGSGCGNEIASERAMVRRFIVDSVVYWATEYKIDGFRFDLMGLHDIQTMNAVRAALDEIDPSIIVYGEGWTGGDTPLPLNERALKQNTPMLDKRIAVFSDDIRDGIKGGVFNEAEAGFVNGSYGRRMDVMFGIAASVEHPQVDLSRVSYSNAYWALEPAQTITYASSHDNHSLWDKLMITRPQADDAELRAMNKLSALIVLTSQGIPFFQAGEEMARTKGGDHNSYQSSDAVNQLNWERKSEYNDLYEYYKGLIALRKARPAFRLKTAGEIADHIEFMETEAQVIAYTIKDNAGGDAAETILVALNADGKDKEIELPNASEWTILVNGDAAGTVPLGTVQGGKFTLKAQSGYVLVQGVDFTEEPEDEEEPEQVPAAEDNEPEEKPFPVVAVVLGGLAFLALIAGAVLLIIKKGKKKE